MALEGEGLDLPSGEGLIEFSCPELPLQPGDYLLAGAIRDAVTQQILAWHSGPPLHVRAGRMVRGSFYVPHTWRLVARGHEVGAR